MQLDSNTYQFMMENSVALPISFAMLGAILSFDHHLPMSLFYLDLKSSSLSLMATKAFKCSWLCWMVTKWFYTFFTLFSFNLISHRNEFGTIPSDSSFTYDFNFLCFPPLLTSLAVSPHSCIPVNIFVGL